MCARSDRCDLSVATACYEAYRRGGEGEASSGHQNDAPKGYSVATQLLVDLFCGSTEIPYDRIRIPPVPASSEGASTAAAAVPEGLYVLEVTDAADPDCVLDGPLPEPAGGREGARPETDGDAAVVTPAAPPRRRPNEVADMVRVVRPLPTNIDVIVKIEAPAAVE